MEKLMETKLLWTGPNLRVKVALVAEVEAEEVSGAEVVAEVEAEAEEADLAEEAGEALEAEVASEAAEEEEVETSSHKGRRRSLNSSFHPILSLFILKKGLWGFYSVTCSMTEPSKDIPRQ